MMDSSAVISFRPIEYADIALFLEWISRPHVAVWWVDTPSVDEIDDGSASN
jgi:hypothetical protein